MGKRMVNNFQKRLKGFYCVYPEKPLEGAQRRLQNERICQAYIELLAGILKRQPTPDEILGIVKISRPEGIA